jgi:uncharacterized protein (DUF1697 family)
MHKYLALLRGINVSGKNKILMKDLKTLCESLGWVNVQTYIQSGNVVFESPAGSEPAKGLSEEIRKTYGFDVPVVIRNLDELRRILAVEPFPGSDPAFQHVTLLESQPEQGLVDAIPAEKYLPDCFLMHGKEIYLYCPGGYGNTKLNNTFFEKKLKTTATTRNRKTITELVRMIEG